MVTGLFLTPRVDPFDATLIRGRDVLTLLVHTTGTGVLQMQGEYCYRAVIRPVEAGRYWLQVAYPYHPVTRDDLLFQTVLHREVTVPGR